MSLLLIFDLTYGQDEVLKDLIAVLVL